MLLGCFVVAVSFGSCGPGDCGGKTAITVGSSSSSDCKSIQAAIECIPNRTVFTPRISLLVAPGVYNETVRIAPPKGQVSILGQGPAETVTLTTRSMCGGADPTVQCGNMWIGADDFILSNMTLWNQPNITAGKTFTTEVSGDRVAIYHTRLLGKDDVVFTGLHRVYFRDCFISGATDFNFGQGSAVYDKCTLMAQPGQYWSFITAHAGNGTVDAGKRTAYLIQDSTLPYSQGERLGTTFLGRPWGPLATVVYKNCWMDKHINPAGWSLGKHSTAGFNVTYGEYNSTGPGANPTQRMKGSYQLTAKQADEEWTIPIVLQGWTPHTEPPAHST